MDTAPFEQWLLIDQSWQPVTVERIRWRMRHAERLGLVLEPWNPDNARAYLQRRLLGGASTHAFNNDVKMLNAWHLFKTGERSKFRQRPKPRSQYKFLTEEQVRQVLTYRHPDGPTERLRRALFLWAVKTGLRVSEISAMNLADLNQTDSKLFVRKPAKRGLKRWLPIEPWVWSPKRPLVAYLKQRPIPSEDRDAMWTTTFTGRGNKRGAQRLTPKAMCDVLRDMGRSVGLPTLNFVITRHTRATELRRQGWDLLLLREYLGHVSVKSTEIYAAVLPTDVASMMKKRPGKDPFQGTKAES